MRYLPAALLAIGVTLACHTTAEAAAPPEIVVRYGWPAAVVPMATAYISHQSSTHQTQLQAQMKQQEMQQQQVSVQESRAMRVQVDEEHYLWPFNGEYWRDELGFYRQQITSRCGR